MSQAYGEAWRNVLNRLRYRQISENRVNVAQADAHSYGLTSRRTETKKKRVMTVLDNAITIPDSKLAREITEIVRDTEGPRNIG